MRRSIISRPISDEEQEIVDRLKALEPERLLRGGPTSTLMDVIEGVCIDARRAVWDRENEVSQRRRENALKQKKLLGPVITAWCKENLRVGDIVKMKGCRDGHGIRRITHLDCDSTYGGIVCEQLQVRGPHSDRRLKLHKNGSVAVCGITEHMWDKVTHTVFVNAHMGVELTPIKERLGDVNNG